MKTITVYAAHGDGGNEYATGPIIGYFSTMQLAEAAAKQRGWYGSDGWVSTYPAFVIEGEYWILKASTPVQLDAEKS